MMKLIDWLTPKRLKFGIVVVPMILAAIYYPFVAADRYVSSATVTVRQASQDASANLPGMAMLLGGINPPSREDTLYLQRYVHSLDMLNRLDARLNLRAHYESEKLDPFYRLYSGASQEWFLEYYRSRVEVLFDDLSSLLTVRVQGFDPEYAQRVAEAIIEESELFVNAFSHRIAQEQMSFAEQELQRAAERLQAAKAEVIAFQNRHKLLDPQAQAEASAVLIAELQATLARQEAELRSLLSYLQEDAHQVQALKGRIAATKAQLEAERRRSTVGSNSERLNELAAKFRDLSLQARFAEDAYKLALSAVENARIDATRKIKSLVVIESPAKPEIAEYPRRIYNLATLFIVCCLLYGVTRLVIATIRDHQD
ncbi:capsular biosynthesis protein [Caldimonas thermodepolymerans]|jgi:Capsule polysaccharide export protein|uniref:capsular biosynthesis protein n=1 Tax=Caldimonas thermodepolymerans TaxID=215580 RepID=UPI002492DB9C|nr:capsular biosynthesis protein [Caldimonas thermodepolymerans]